MSFPHPFQNGFEEMSVIGGLLEHWFGMSLASATALTPGLRPPRYMATTLFLSSGISVKVSCGGLASPARTCSGVIFQSERMYGDTTRLSGFPWHFAQWSSNRMAPSVVWACAGLTAGQSITTSAIKIQANRFIAGVSSKLNGSK